MVDFQSRDTRRGPGGDTADEADERDETSEQAATPDPDEETGEFGPEALPFAVVTVASGQSVEEDAAGAAVVDAIEREGNAVSTRELVTPAYDGVQSTLSTLAGRDDVGAVVTLGGTGVSPDDVTVDAAEPLFDKRLPGFGELYRVLSHDVEGTAVVRTRATAGIVDSVPVFCLPGDIAAARRGVEAIVLEEAEALAAEASPGE